MLSGHTLLDHIVTDTVTNSHHAGHTLLDHIVTDTDTVIMRGTHS